MHDQTVELEAAAFRRLVAHLQEHKEVQNIELMILADFCRNCLAKWYAEAAEERGVDVNYEQAREIVYGMPYHPFSLKVEPDAFSIMVQKPGIDPAPYLAKHSWIRLAHREVIPLAAVEELLKESHALVASKLSKKVRRSLGIEAA